MKARQAGRQISFLGLMAKCRMRGFPKIRSLHRSDREKAVAQIWTQFGADSVNEVVSRAAVSPFLNGEGKKHFVATFDWIFKPENFLKILEGNYRCSEILKTPIWGRIKPLGEK
jgi:hypothetical protein